MDTNKEANYRYTNGPKSKCEDSESEDSESKDGEGGDSKGEEEIDADTGDNEAL